MQVIPSTFEENLDKNALDAASYARETAVHKAREVFEGLVSCGSLPDLVIGADTVVEFDGTILEKPFDAAHAKSMLQALRGTKHNVHTGVAFVTSDERNIGIHQHSFTETTRVSFCNFSDADIDTYIASKEPFGKAGSYGIQGLAGAFVIGIEGCYFNVVGFPINRFCKEVGDFMN